jgi:hypothetical protein
MLPIHARPWRRRAIQLVLLTYACVVLILPSLHHDFACHQNSRSHCASCVLSQPGADPAAAQPPGTWSLPDAGRMKSASDAHWGVLFCTAQAGRSPPGASIL